MCGRDDTDALALFIGLFNGLISSVILWVVLGTAAYAVYHVPLSALVATVQGAVLALR